MSEQEQDEYRRGYRARATGAEYDRAGGIGYAKGWTDSGKDHRDIEAQASRGRHARPAEGN